MEPNSIDNSNTDLILLLLMMSLAGIGFLMKYVLVPRFEWSVALKDVDVN